MRKKFTPTEKKGSRRFLECGKEALLTQLVSEAAREGTSLDLFFVNRGEPVGDIVVGGCLAHGDHKIMLSSLRKGKGVSRTASLDFQRTRFGPFRNVVTRITWVAVLSSKEVQEGWTLLTKC